MWATMYVLSGKFSSLATDSSVLDPRSHTLLSACSLNSGKCIVCIMCLSEANCPPKNGGDNHSDAGGIEQVWSFEALTNVRVYGLPLEELLFGFTFGLMWTVIYEHFTWKHSVTE